MRGGAELLGGSLGIISMQAAAISMQMPRCGPGGELLFIILLARGAHTGFLHFSLQLWSPVTASRADTEQRHCASELWSSVG